MWQGISDMKAGQKAGLEYGKQKILKGASARYRKWLAKYAAAVLKARIIIDFEAGFPEVMVQVIQREERRDIREE